MMTLVILPLFVGSIFFVYSCDSSRSENANFGASIAVWKVFEPEKWLYTDTLYCILHPHFHWRSIQYGFWRKVISGLGDWSGFTKCTNDESVNEEPVNFAKHPDADLAEHRKFWRMCAHTVSHRLKKRNLFLDYHRFYLQFL